MSNDTKTLQLLAAKVRELQRLVREKIGTTAAITYVNTTVSALDATALKKAQNLSDVANVATARGNILPAKTGQSLKVLRVNSGETDYELATITSGVTDHGALSGLGDDDHTQYHTDARGDTRYDAIGAAAAAQAASQPLDSDLTAIAALSTTSFGRAFLALADAAAGRSYLSLGTAATSNTGDFDAAGAASAAQAASQPLDSDLTAIAALSTTSFGRAFLALADAAAGRSYLALGTAATSNTGDFDAAGAAAAAQAASQPLDSDLTAIAALSTTSFGRAFLALADAAAGRSYLSLGTAATSNTGDFDTAGAAAAAQAASQPLDSDLTAIAALSTTSFGRSFLALADAAAGRTYLALGTAAQLDGTAGTEVAYTGTISWPTGTPPSSLTAARQFYEQTGNVVHYYISAVYGNAGASNTNVTFTLPAEFPTPVVPNSMGGASSRIYPATLKMRASLSGADTNGTTHGVNRNAANNGWEISSPSQTFTSNAPKVVTVSGFYFTA